MSAALLIVEDEALIRQTLRRMLERHGHRVSEADCVDSACQHDLSAFDLIISDVRLPGVAGTHLIELARPTPVLIMTSYSDTRDAVAAMRAGAVDYLIKPFDHQELLAAIDSSLRRSKPAAAQRPSVKHTLGMIGNSPAMVKLYDEIRMVAPLATTVLIQGESGTGKELVAKALHQLSPRAKFPMIAVNCASIPDSLMEDELFGHEKGAFTGASSSRKGLVEAADQSTLFLDEIGELPLDAQARLLRLLQEREIRRLGTHETRKVDIRLIAATHRNLEQMVSDGQFRADLFFRLNVVALNLPPLFARGGDLELLIQHIMQQLCQRHDKQIDGLCPDALQRLKRHHWPGNIRELQNVLEYAVIMCKDHLIPASLIRLPDTLPAAEQRSRPNMPALLFDDDIPLLTESTSVGGRLLQQQFIELVRQLEPKLNETQLAEQLGISRKTLWERRKTLGIPRIVRRRTG